MHTVTRSPDHARDEAALAEAIERLAGARAAALSIAEDDALTLESAWRSLSESESRAVAHYATMCRLCAADEAGDLGRWEPAHSAAVAAVAAYASLWARLAVEERTGARGLHLALSFFEALYRLQCWEYLGRGPYSSDVWMYAGRLLLELGPESGGVGPIVEVFKRMFVLGVAGTERLPRALLPTLFDLSALLSKGLDLHPEYVPSARYLFPLDAHARPRRLTREPEAQARALYLNAPSVHEVQQKDSTAWRLCIEHLSAQWAEQLPMRRYRRHSVDTPMDVVPDFHSILATLEGVPVQGLRMTAEDLSRGGVGLLHLSAEGPPLEVGRILAMRAVDAGHWGVGIVRRVERTGTNAWRLGVQTLSHRIESCLADDGRIAQRVVLCDRLRRGEAVRMVLAKDGLEAGGPLYLQPGNGEIAKLVGLGELLDGGDFVVGVFQFR